MYLGIMGYRPSLWLIIPNSRVRFFLMIVESTPDLQDSETTTLGDAEDKPQPEKSVVERGECLSCTYGNPLTG